MTRWLVTGATGMLGSDVVAAATAAGHTVVAAGRADVDVTDAARCLEALAGVDVVVNCAAWADVDGAETHEGEAFAVNAVGPHNLAVAASRHGAVLVHPSTDYVFDGAGTAPYAVDAPVDPVNAYGRTKAAGEWAVRAECERAYVVRTAWLYGRAGGNFVDTMLRLATERDQISVVDDQRGQPTWARDLAAGIVRLVGEAAPFGTYHGTAAGETTWFGLARAALEDAGHDPAKVVPTTSAAFPRPAARPTYSVLAHRPELQLPDWRRSLRAYVTGEER